VQSVLNLVYLALLVNAVGMVLLAATGVDVLTSISAVAACMFNVGPGLGLVARRNTTAPAGTGEVDAVAGDDRRTPGVLHAGRHSHAHLLAQVVTNLAFSSVFLAGP